MTMPQAYKGAMMYSKCTILLSARGHYMVE